MAEAFAEKMHADVRKKHWGYDKEENLSQEDILKVNYQGIRPAPGYPSQPDHTEKNTLWKLLDVNNRVGIELTESLAMLPASAVSGLYFANPHAKYFATGLICEDQIKDYAKRKQMEKSEVEKWLHQNLGYEVDI